MEKKTISASTGQNIQVTMNMGPLASPLRGWYVADGSGNSTSVKINDVRTQTNDLGGMKQYISTIPVGSFENIVPVFGGALRHIGSTWYGQVMDGSGNPYTSSTTGGLSFMEMDWNDAWYFDPTEFYADGGTKEPRVNNIHIERNRDRSNQISPYHYANVYVVHTDKGFPNPVIKSGGSVNRESNGYMGIYVSRKETRDAELKTGGYVEGVKISRYEISLQGDHPPFSYNGISIIFEPERGPYTDSGNVELQVTLTVTDNSNSGGSGGIGMGGW